MLQHFLVSQKKGGVEDGVNLPLRWNPEVEGSPRDDFFDFEGASSFHLEFLGAVHVKVGSFEPDLISHFPWGKFGGYLFFHLLLCNLVGGLGVIMGSG